MLPRFSWGKTLAYCIPGFGLFGGLLYLGREEATDKPGAEVKFRTNVRRIPGNLVLVSGPSAVSDSLDPGDFLGDMQGKRVIVIDLKNVTSGPSLLKCFCHSLRLRDVEDLSTSPLGPTSQERLSFLYRKMNEYMANPRPKVVILKNMENLWDAPPEVIESLKSFLSYCRRWTHKKVQVLAFCANTELANRLRQSDDQHVYMGFLSRQEVADYLLRNRVQKPGTVLNMDLEFGLTLPAMNLFLRELEKHQDISEAMNETAKILKRVAESDIEHFLRKYTKQQIWGVLSQIPSSLEGVGIAQLKLVDQPIAQGGLKEVFDELLLMQVLVHNEHNEFVFGSLFHYFYAQELRGKK